VARKYGEGAEGKKPEMGWVSAKWDGVKEPAKEE
jgi:hypothetical protein